MKIYLKYFLYLCIVSNFMVGNSNDTFLQPKAHESSLHDKITNHEPRAFIFKDMKGNICVEVDEIFYESCCKASRFIGCTDVTIKSRCLSNKHPNYKIVPYRVTYTKKECPKCKITKPLKGFDKDSSRKDGLCYECKECKKIYRQNNKERTAEYKKGWYKDNPDYNKTYRQNNKEEIIKHEKEYRSYPEVKNRRNKQAREKRKTDITFKINEIMSGAIRRSLNNKKNGAHWETLVDYDLKKLMVHLESKFTEGMSWDNYGKGKYKWNLDHKIPVCKWNITSNTCQEFKDCWALKNLQPLWETRNQEKGDKPMEPKYLIKPF